MKHLQACISNFISSKIKDQDAVRDLTQETLLRVYTKSGDVEIRNLEAWSIRVARNLVIDHFRNKSRPLYVQPGNEYDPFTDRLIACQDNYIKELDPESQLLIKAVDLEGISQKELAQKLGISYVNLRSKIRRARKNIKSKFERDCKLEHDVNGMIMSCCVKKC